MPYFLITSPCLYEKVGWPACSFAVWASEISAAGQPTLLHKHTENFMRKEGMSRDNMVKRGSKASRTLILDFPKSFQTGGLKLKWTRLKNHINWSTVAWISVHSGNSKDFSNLNQICRGYYVTPATTLLSLLFCASPGFVTTTTHMLCLYLTQGYSNDSVRVT